MKAIPIRLHEIHPTIDANYFKGQSNQRRLLALRKNDTTRRGGSVDNKHSWDTYMIDGKIRRLTPRECERLMGWPSKVFYAKIELCSDQAKTLVDAVNKNLRLQSLVSSVEAEKLEQIAVCVTRVLSQNNQQKGDSVQENVSTNTQEKTVNPRTQTEEPSNADSVGNSEQSEHQRIRAIFAQADVSLSIIEGRTILVGKEALQAKEGRQILQHNGKDVYELSGDEMVQYVRDAKISSGTNLLNSSMFTTSDHSEISSLDLILIISYYFASRVIDGFTLYGTKKKNISLLLEVSDGWTRWGVNDKGETVEMSDSQRYKMCGNGVVSAVVKEVYKII